MENEKPETGKWKMRNGKENLSSRRVIGGLGARRRGAR
jgi:hypothetical protein